MCDDYEDEAMAVFWRRLEQTDGRKRLTPEPEEVVEPLVRIEPAPAETKEPRPRALMR